MTSCLETYELRLTNEVVAKLPLVHCFEPKDHCYSQVDFLQGFCPYGQHNRMADILFKTPEGGLHAMLHAPYGNYASLLAN